MPRSGRLWRRRTSRRWLVAVTASPQIMRHSLVAPPCCPHICVSPPAGEPAASLAAVGGDGERRELLRGGTPASLRGPGPAAQQQGANCGNVFVCLVDGKRSVTPVTATPVRHSPVFNNEETKTLQSRRNQRVPVVGLTLPPNGRHWNCVHCGGNVTQIVTVKGFPHRVWEDVASLLFVRCKRERDK